MEPTTNTYTLRQLGTSWYVVSDGSSVGFADRWSAEQYLSEVIVESGKVALVGNDFHSTRSCLEHLDGSVTS